MLRVVVEWKPSGKLKTRGTADSAGENASKFQEHVTGTSHGDAEPLQDSQQPNLPGQSNKVRTRAVPQGSENVPGLLKSSPRPCPRQGQTPRTVSSATNQVCLHICWPCHCELMNRASAHTTHQGSEEQRCQALLEGAAHQASTSYIHTSLRPVQAPPLETAAEMTKPAASSHSRTQAASSSAPPAQSKQVSQPATWRYAPANPKPASHHLADSFAKYTGWLGAHHMCLRHDDRQGRYAVRSVKTDRGACILQEWPLMHWLMSDVAKLCTFCFKPLGKL